MGEENDGGSGGEQVNACRPPAGIIRGQEMGEMRKGRGLNERLTQMEGG